MTSHSENGSRLNRIEALMLELATASVRHDNEFSRINAILDRNAQQIESLTHRIEANSQQIEANSRQGALNQESIQNLTASIQDLRNLVADYIQGRSNT
jgi:chromosome segregation ATPase